MSASHGPPRVKNKSAAPLQITAEQLLREAVERQEPTVQAPHQRLEDLEELHEFQARKRKEFEDYIRRNRLELNNWLRYASWELEQKEYARARSVFERSLDVHAREVRVWLRYIDSELKTRNINHARNLLDRAVTILPRVDKLWLKYVATEEMLGNVTGTRAVFNRWMQWLPDVSAWSAYIKFELRYNEVDLARAIFERLTQAHPGPAQWIKWAKFEMEHGTTDIVREVFSEAVETLGEDFINEKIFLEFARFEVRMKEYERARALYKWALDRLPRSKSENLHKAYVQFEKQFGDSEGVESVVLTKRRVKYEEELQHNSKNYDIWIELARLEETAGDVERVRDAYERAIAQVPPPEKRFWKRYIYLFLFYASFEETVTRDLERAGQVYRECIKLIPHKQFTFAKVWIAKARFEIRQMDLVKARKTMGTAIGKCPKDRLFRSYIEFEKTLYEFDRVRKLYERQISWDPTSSQAWINFAQHEENMEDFTRARGIFEIAISQDSLDAPEAVWKYYIDFETDQGEYDKAREVYERLLKQVPHHKVFTSFANWEVAHTGADAGGEAEAGDDAIERGRQIFARADKVLKDVASKDEVCSPLLGSKALILTIPQRAALLQSWQTFELQYGDDEHIDAINGKLPELVKKRRRLDDNSFEEYEDWVFPGDDEGIGRATNLLSMAIGGDSDSDSDED